MPTMRNYMFVLAIIGVSFIVAGCSNAQVANIDTHPPVAQSTAQSTPSKKFTAADVAKLKWIEGTWRGMDGDKPFTARVPIEYTQGQRKNIQFPISSQGFATGDYRIEIYHNGFKIGEGVRSLKKGGLFC